MKQILLVIAYFIIIIILQTILSIYVYYTDDIAMFDSFIARWIAAGVPAILIHSLLGREKFELKKKSSIILIVLILGWMSMYFWYPNQSFNKQAIVSIVSLVFTSFAIGFKIYSRND